MDLQNLFKSSEPFHICIVFFIFFTLAKHTLSIDTKFQACMPRTCGNDLNISYPFWIPHEQESFCGLPSFEVICRDRNSFFSISNVEYIIKDIFYANYSLLVANAAAYKDTCPAPLHNISIHRTQLDLSSDNSDFSIFYNCTSFPDYPIYEIECASKSFHLYSFATFHKEVLEQNYSSRSCQSSVDVHRGCNTRILHFDIKSHNILLDANFCPKISDFGLSKICPRENSIISMLGARGTVGYIALEVFCRNFGGVSHKSDVYSYGMMVLEMVGGTNNIDAETNHTSETYFPHWIYRHLELDKELWMQGIINEEDEQNVKKMIIVGLWCIQTNPSNRPTMSRVVDMLEGSLNSLQIPPKPFLSSPSRSIGDSLTEMVLHSDSMIP